MRLVASFLLVSAALAQNTQPDVTNAHFEDRVFSGNLESQLNAKDAIWFGYAVSATRRVESEWCARCYLEQSFDSADGERSRHRVALEGAGTVVILFRVERGFVEKIRVNSIDCPLDAGGLPFVWLQNVPQSASLSLLEHLARANSSDSVRDGAIFAISEHEGAEAVAALERLARPPQPSQVRSQAIFWLAQRAGEKAASFISNAIQNDPDTEVKTKAVFALSQLPRDEGVPRLIEVARSNNSREVRKQAFFWLGQSQDPRALAFIEQILAH